MVFIIVVFIIFINTIYQPCIPSSIFSKWAYFASLSYKYIKIWYLFGLYKASGLGTNKICYIFYLRHVSSVAAHFQKKNNMFIYVTNKESQESGKY